MSGAAAARAVAPMEGAAGAARFDHYAFTLAPGGAPDGDGKAHERARAVIGELVGPLGYDPVWTRSGALRRFYGSCEALNGEDGAAAILLAYGGPNGVHVVLNGVVASGLVAPVRELFPGHRVARVDSAIDLRLPGGGADFARFAGEMKAAGVVKAVRVFDEQTLTVELGSRASPFRVVGYEKGKVIQAGSPLAAAAGCAPGLEDVFRFEGRLRPHSRGKGVGALVSADELWSRSRLGKRVYDYALGLDAPRVSADVLREAQAALARAEPLPFMRQYRRRVRGLRDDCGCAHRLGFVYDLHLARVEGRPLPLAQTPGWVLSDGPCPYEAEHGPDDARWPRARDLCRGAFAVELAAVARHAGAIRAASLN